MAVLELRNLSKRFGNVAAVNDLSFTAAEGEFLVLVGPSGCGKTTTLRMIAGLETITEGELLLDGKCINALPPKDRDMAMVFQDYALYPHMSVRDNMAFGLKMRGIPKKERYRQVEDVAETLGIERLIDRKPAALSGGERQRVALGRAIVRRPKIFLFDEPLSNLDAALRVQMRADLKQLHSEIKTTFIYVTHDQTEAMTMATRIAVLDKGELQQFGRPSEIYNSPANTFVARFVGTPRMNLIECYLNMQDNRMICYIGNTQLELPENMKGKLLAHRLCGQKAILGIRPENIHITDDIQGMRMEIAYTENVGAFQYVYLTCESVSEHIVIIMDGTANPVKKVSVIFDWNAAKFYDYKTHRVIAQMDE